MVWNKIKQAFVANERVMSTGYQYRLAQAALLFVSLERNIKDFSKEARAFNDDKEVTVAMMNKSSIAAVMGESRDNG